MNAYNSPPRPPPLFLPARVSLCVSCSFSRRKYAPPPLRKAMWNKAEENADALREAFEEAAERAAEEAELATAEALARAERDYRGAEGSVGTTCTRFRRLLSSRCMLSVYQVLFWPCHQVGASSSFYASDSVARSMRQWPYHAVGTAACCIVLCPDKLARALVARDAAAEGRARLEGRSRHQYGRPDSSEPVLGRASSPGRQRGDDGAWLSRAEHEV